MITRDEYLQMDIRQDHGHVDNPGKALTVARYQQIKSQNRSWKLKNKRNGEDIISEGVASKLVLKDVKDTNPSVEHQIGYKSSKVVIAEYVDGILTWLDK